MSNPRNSLLEIDDRGLVIAIWSISIADSESRRLRPSSAGVLSCGSDMVLAISLLGDDRPDQVSSSLDMETSWSDAAPTS